MRFLLIFLFSVCPHGAESAKAVIKDYGLEMRKETPNYTPLVVKATQAIEAMHAPMSAQDASDTVALLQLNEATDPGRTLFDDTYAVLKKNKAALKAALKKLPAKEAQSLTSAIDTAINANEHGQD